MREIPLANGRGVALVDDEDYELVSQYTWAASTTGNQTYAVHRYDGDGKRRSLRMHRLILTEVPIVDHKDGNGLNNTRKNLRAANNRTNAFNTGPYSRRRGKTSRFKGVSFVKDARPPERPWRAVIRAFGTDHFLGNFASQEEAAQAYDGAARRHHGEFARLNFPDRKPIRAERESSSCEKEARGA
jgi:hypothetical protein